MKKLIFSILFLTRMFHAYSQQEAQFSQYIFNGLYINPAYAGYKEEMYTQMFYRSQWIGVEGAPKTLAASIDGASESKNVGMGLLISYDAIGAQSNMSAYANYAYRLQIGKDESSRLSFGLGFGAIQAGIDGSKLTSIDGNDNLVPTNTQSSLLPDARAGIFFSNKRMFAGFSATNLLAQYFMNGKDNNLKSLVPKLHYYFTAGAIFQTSPDVAVKPSFLLKDDDSGPTSLDLNLFFLFKNRVWLGGFYRTSVKLYEKPYLPDALAKSNAMGIITELFATEKLRLGYSFDYSLNRLQNNNYGAHEVSLGYYFSKKKSRELKCFF